MKNKVIYTLTILMLMVILLPSIAYAILFDIETSTGNTFTASTLDAQISPSTWLELDIADPNERTIQFTLENIGQLKTSNNIYIENMSNLSFSDLITAELKLNGTTQHTGILTDLNISDYLDQDTSQLDSIVITLAISNDDLETTAGQTLEFTIISKSYQLDGDPNIGFFDREAKLVKITNSTE
jgi:hypothetical protein